MTKPMEKTDLTLSSRPCTVYACGDPACILIQPVDESDAMGLAEEAEAIEARTGGSFLLAAFRVYDWNAELSPWEAPPVFGKSGFGSGACATLGFIENELLPELRSRYGLPGDIPVLLGGYSLAGFFALWAAYQTGAFRAAACASPSVWFPGWIEYAGTHSPKAGCVYLSLGDREERTKNKLMATVGGCIREQHTLLLRALGEDNCTLEWNEGNHFKDAALRTAKAFAWCMERTTE